MTPQEIAHQLDVRHQRAMLKRWRRPRMPFLWRMAPWFVVAEAAVAAVAWAVISG